ncbi:MAG: hypothetical protein ACRD2X_03220 [Vicinamibacteraceae bacterium]
MADTRDIIVGVKGPERTASIAALTTAAGAVACGISCVLPFALPAAAGTGSVLAWFAGAYRWATALARVIVTVAWISIVVQSRQARIRPSRATLYSMALATAALVLAILWSRVQPYLIRLLTQK